MVIGDGVLTSALSVFSTVSDVELAMAKEHHKRKTLILFIINTNTILLSRLSEFG
ncbi:hypothetical protein Ccrd_024420 [Cynara cardunculus var. scolymus]|uniref:Uncharacterized protein n=1 Tax=Cynara cardunculus var. scolymus TaxID=59895 RepID=A0A103XCH0_CYNCS|nr:hypothetical protein Ccrd_024420 [Cynara cardunculus var. scolymus]